MNFITVTHHNRRHPNPLEPLPQKDGWEQWKITGSKGELKMTNNRPLQQRKGLMHRPPTRKHVFGTGLYT